MTGATNQSTTLQQLLVLHETDQEILAAERELQRYGEELATLEEEAVALQARLEKLEGELERARADARRGERAVDERRSVLDRLRTRVNHVRNERQYSAATLEFDLVRQDLRKLEDQVLERLQKVEDLENARQEIVTQLESLRARGEPRREEIRRLTQEFQDQLAIKKDRRRNLAIRIDSGALVLYDRIRAGRSQVAMAPLTEEGVCGNCFTAVTVQQELQIKNMSTLVCCEVCGVILYATNLKP